MDIREVDRQLSEIQKDWLLKGDTGKAILYTLLICCSLLAFIGKQLAERRE